MHFQGSALKEARKAAGLSQRELAERSGVGESTIDYLENNRTKGPRTTTLQQLASALGKSWLLFFEVDAQKIERSSNEGTARLAP